MTIGDGDIGERNPRRTAQDPPERIGRWGTVDCPHDVTRTEINDHLGGTGAQSAGCVATGPAGDDGTELVAGDRELGGLHHVAVGQTLQTRVAKAELRGGAWG